MNEDYKIDPDLQAVMPVLSDDEKDELEKSLLMDGYKGAPIFIWKDIIIDGHNRYQICKKHGIPFEVMNLEFENREEVIQWMIRAQLGRRNLNTAQRIALVRKFRPSLEAQAKKNQREAGGDKKSEEYKKSVTENLPQANTGKRNPTVDKRLADMINTSEKTFHMGDIVLNSENNELKKAMLSGEKAVSAAYKELRRLERDGRTISIPEQMLDGDATKAEENVTNNEEDIVDMIIRLQEQYGTNCNKLCESMEWLLTKQFYNDKGDEVTAKLCSDIRNCLDKIRELETVIRRMNPDDCGGMDIIIVSS